MSIFPISQHIEGSHDVLFLRSFCATASQEDDSLANKCEVDSVPRSDVNSKLLNSAPY